MTRTEGQLDRSSLHKADKADSGLVTRFFNCIFTWRERARQRRQLAELSGQLLRDIGISRAEVEQEISRPFWKH